ncbi:Single-stranded DNA-binding protein B [Paraconexibacter sp. AEG42_29]|uniref:Single-stranded DNA-binding protein n=1 Tax=Paraconexibacter sp. AEG42_29 TaxID=2997339 RepID=A0AAU7AWJ6_9ACTN
MSSPANHVQLIGRLTADPNLRTSPSDKAICEMRLAVDGLGGKDTVGYINVSCWNAAGEACARQLTKGWAVAVCGELRIVPWRTEQRSGTDVAIPFASVKFLTAPRTRTENPVSDPAPEQTAAEVRF